ncbi:MAG: ABC transporter ATP-binding protein [Proteobacteria bacterium]|nr:ABC transporter ATP-binding protein [Pseudomonadota bacterium]
MDSTLIVKAEKISVKYQLSEFKSDSLKEWVLNRIRGRGSRREFTAVDQVSFELRRGESLALVGHNGSGKSTLLRAIAGIIPATGGGRVAVMGRIAPMIELGAGFDGELSGRENIYLSCLLMGLDKAEIDSRIADIIAFSELKEFIESPVKNYSSGMYARLGFACATAVDPDLLIVDEVLAVGDSNFAAKCLRRIEELRHKGVSVILVSHDEATVRRFCDRALVLNRGKMLHDGDIETAYRIQTDIMEARAREAMTPEELQRLMKHQELIQRKADAEGDARLQPVLLVSLNVIQHGVTVTILNLMEPFTFEFAVLITDSLFYVAIESESVLGLTIAA